MSESRAIAPYAPPVPPRPVLPAAIWPLPETGPGLLLPVGAGVSALAAAWFVPYTEPGIGFVLAALLAVATVAVIGWRRVDRLDLGLGAVAVLLLAVAGLRASEWLVALCVAGAIGLAAVVVLRVRKWTALLLALPFLGFGAIRSLPWLTRPVARVKGGKLLWSWVRGSAIGVVAVWVVGALLVSADAAFARVIDVALPTFTADQLIARTFVGVCTAGLVVAGAFSVLSPPRWEAVPDLPNKPRPAVEWLVPVALLDGLLGLFFAVQATVLFGGDAVVRELGVSYADRARQGFGELVAVTLLVGLLLTWVASRVVRSSRRQLTAFALAGGALVALTLLLVLSALRRLWLYEEAYGWTMLRLLSGCFEIWLGIVLVGAVLAYALNRTALLPRALVLAAGLGLLLLALAGPDALVAAGNVHRLQSDAQRTTLDSEWVYDLSADAVPQLNRLPEPYRTQALAVFADDGLGTDPWYGWNWGRWRAGQVLGD